MLQTYFSKACLFVGFLVAANSQAAIIYVDQGSGGVPDGLTWGTAWLDIQTALSVATAGDEIWVAQGTYKADPTNQAVSFHLNGTADIAGIYGGFDASTNPSNICDANPNTYITTLSGEINGSGLNDNTERIILVSALNANMVIQGFHIEYGYADGGGAADFGAGVHYTAGSTFQLSIRACTLFKNSAKFGGGVYVGANGVIDMQIGCGLENNLLSNNASRGGGLYVDPGSTVTLSDSYFGTNSANRGGGIFYRGCASITEQNIIMEQNTASADGGAIYEGFCPIVNANHCLFNANNASSSGGAIFSTSCTRTIVSSNFDLNTANTGGAITAVTGTLNTNTTTVSFTDNVASSHGGAIYLDGVALANLEESYYSGNQAGGNGGGVYAFNGSDVDVLTSHFENNSAVHGGGICVDNADLNVDDCDLNDNQAQNGGGIYAYQAALDVNSTSTFTSNVASDNGGAIYMEDFNGAVISDVDFTSNEATSGGAIAGITMQAQIANTNFGDDNASYQGGAIWVKNSPAIDIAVCAFDQNSTPSALPGNRGGAIYGLNSSIEIVTSVFQGCSSMEGGVAMMEGSNWHSDDCSYEQNSATHFGGVFYGDASDFEIENDEFIDNFSNEAGAFYVINGCVVIMRNSMAIANTANGNGGFMMNQHSSDVYVGNFSAIANRSSASGGVFSSESNDANFYIANMMGTCNYAGQGNIYSSTSGGETMRMYFSSFTNNTHPDGISFTTGRNVMSTPAGPSAIIANSVFWQNQDHTFCGNPTVEFTDNDGAYDCSGFIGLPWPGAGNVSTDPFFLDVDGGDNLLCTEDDDLRLSGISPISPCIDIGSSGATHFPGDFADVDDDGDYAELLPIDILGAARTYNGTPDMGAYENDGTYKGSIEPAFYATKGNLYAFPNPANNMLNVISGNEIKQVSLFNLNGQLMIVDVNIATGQAQVDLSALTSGIYVLRVLDAQGESTLQVEKL